MANEGEGRSWGRIARIAGVGILGASACGAGYFLLDRFGGDNDPVITAQGTDTATATMTVPSGAFGFGAVETPGNLPIATQILAARTVAPNCGVIDGRPGAISGHPNTFRVVLSRVGIANFTNEEMVTVYDNSGEDMDGDLADGSIKHGPKRLIDYVDSDWVHNGDIVCVDLPGSAPVSTEAAPSPAVPTSTLEPTPNSTYAPPVSGQEVNCSNLGMTLDNAITEMCITTGQGDGGIINLTCSGEGGRYGAVEVGVYDYDLNLSDNPLAVSIIPRVNHDNGEPRAPFGSNCNTWRSDLPYYMRANPDLFILPTPTPAPTETPSVPTSNIERETWSVVRGERTNSEDAVSLHAASVQSKGTLYADVFVSARRNESVSRNIPRLQIRRERV